MAEPSTVRQGMKRSQAVARDEELVGGEQAGDLLLVRLQLVEGVLGRGLGVARVLELDDGQREAVDEHDHIGTAVRLALDHGELVDRQPVVGLGVVEVDEPSLVAGDAAVRSRVLDVDAVDEHAMEAAVVLEQARALEDEDPLERVVDRRCRQPGIDTFERGAQTPREDDFGEVVPLGRQLLGFDVRAKGDLVAEFAKPGEHGFFNVRLDDRGPRSHGCPSFGRRPSGRNRTPWLGRARPRRIQQEDRGKESRRQSAYTQAEMPPTWEPNA
jgi:hypothetical protein